MTALADLVPAGGELTCPRWCALYDTPREHSRHTGPLRTIVAASEVAGAAPDVLLSLWRRDALELGVAGPTYVEVTIRDGAGARVDLDLAALRTLIRELVFIGREASA